eukprot:3086057-Amphidinium_carterae.1
MSNSTWLWTCVQAPLEDPHSIALRATVWDAATCHWRNVCAAEIGPVRDTWLHQLVWPGSIPCARTTPAWRSGQRLTFRTFGDTGEDRHHTVSLESRLNTCSQERSQVCLGYRQQGWIPPTSRIGEAKKPGPTICRLFCHSLEF